MLYLLLTLIILSHVSFYATAMRLQTKHQAVFEEMRLDGMVFCGSFEQVGRILKFVLKGKHAQLNDSFLTVCGYLFAGSFVTTLPLLALCVLLYT